MSLSTQIAQHVTYARLIRPGFWLAVGNAIRIGITWYRIGNIDGRDWWSGAGKIWAGIYGNRHGQSSLVDQVKHVSGHIVPGRPA